jgi:hypothetical protein
MQTGIHDRIRWQACIPRAVGSCGCAWVHHFFMNSCFDRVIIGVISLLGPDILIYSPFVSNLIPICSSNRPIIYVANWTFQCTEVVLPFSVACSFLFSVAICMLFYIRLILSIALSVFLLLAVRMDSFAGGLHSVLLRIRACTSRAV